MSLNTTTARNDYTGNGATSVYAYGFKIFSATDLKVTKRDTNDVESLLVYNTDYTVTGVGSLSGGNITLTAGNLPTSYHLTIRRVRPLTQTTDIRNQGPFYPEVHEDAFDHQVMLAQQQQDELDRAITLPETVTGVSTELPVPEAGKILLWNDGADGITHKSASSLGSIVTVGGGLELISGDLRLATMVDASKYSSIKAACTAIGSVNLRTLVIYAPINASNSSETVTITPNISVYPLAPGVINKGSATSLTILAPVVGNPMHQWLSGFAAGEVQFYNQATTQQGNYLIYLVYPIWFGAKGDNSTDNTLAIQSAIESIPWGGWVCFTPGVFRFSDITIPHHSGINIMGSGYSEYSDPPDNLRFGTILLYTGSDTAFEFTHISGCFYGSMKDFGLYKLNWSGSDTTFGIVHTGNTGGSGEGLHHFKFSNVVVGGFKYGLWLKNSWLNNYYDCEFGQQEYGLNPNWCGVYLEVANANNFYGCKWHNNRIGLWNYNSQHVNVYGGSAEQNNLDTGNWAYDTSPTNSAKAFKTSNGGETNIDGVYLEKNNISIYTGDGSQSRVKKCTFRSNNPGESSSSYFYEDGSPTWVDYDDNTIITPAVGSILTQNPGTDLARSGMYDEKTLFIGGRRITRNSAGDTFEFRNFDGSGYIGIRASALTVTGDTILASTLKSGANQGTAGAAVGEFWVDTSAGNVIKRGV